MIVCEIVSILVVSTVTASASDSGSAIFLILNLVLS